MRYKIGDFTIKSENTAKSIKQHSKEVVNVINQIGKKRHILDLGCGKLRYGLFLKKQAYNITFVDSKEQIFRVQKICNRIISFKEYVLKEVENSRVLSIEEFHLDNEKYDFVFCSNVLSAIPCVETRNNLLKKVLNSLESEGEALFITQYTNSFYKKIDSDKYMIKHLDGYIVTKNNNIATYYGLLDLSKLKILMENAGFYVVEKWRINQSAFIKVRKKDEF